MFLMQLKHSWLSECGSWVPLPELAQAQALTSCFGCA